MSIKLLLPAAVFLAVGFGLVISSFFSRPQSPATEPTPLPKMTLTTNQDVKASPPTLRDDAKALAPISAQSYIAYDVASGEVITAKDPDKRLMPASTTKMMTALIALSEYDPKEIMTVSRASEAIGHIVDFIPGEQFRAEDMIRAMMINSGNDAAVSLADHHPSGYQVFVSLMNQKAISLGLKNTHFSNVSGVEADDHYSSARDLVTIAVEAMKNTAFREIVSTKTATITTIDGKRTHKLENLNKLLWDVPGVIGVKTGWTENAGDCLVSYSTRNNHDIIVVVLNSTNRFADSTKLIEWVYQNARW